jgi:ABC-type transporter Mla subunit MlaD
MNQEQIKQLAQITDNIEAATTQTIKKVEVLAITARHLADTMAQLRAAVDENWRALLEHR